jgi:hypothetical protein
MFDVLHAHRALINSTFFFVRASTQNHFQIFLPLIKMSRLHVHPNAIDQPKQKLEQKSIIKAEKEEDAKAP